MLAKSNNAKDSAPTADTPTVTIYEDWDEIDGEIWYKWRVVGEKDWHRKRTAHKQKPVIRFKQLSKLEFDEFYKKEGK